MALSQAGIGNDAGFPQLQLITSANLAAYLIASPTAPSLAKSTSSSPCILTGSILQEYAAPAIPKPLFARALAIPAHAVPCAASAPGPGFGLLSGYPYPPLKSQPS